jgi:ribonuclease HI
MVIDGACIGNPGPGGWACLLRFGEHQREFTGFEHETTNNRMELEAAIGGFRALKKACRVTVITDSQYVQLGMTKYLPSWKEKGWVKSNGDRVLNRDLWEQLDVLTQSHEVAWRWIPGHQGHPDQNRCDLLARLHARNSRPRALEEEKEKRALLDAISAEVLVSRKSYQASRRRSQ